MSYLLRHNPGDIGIELDSAGWVQFDLFVDALRDATGFPTRDDVVDAIEQNDKQRFELDAGRIRAAQGHSIDVDLGLTPVSPPARLWHGTVERFLASIMTGGLVAKERTHVHLSDTIDVAKEVGARRGVPIILSIDAEEMAKDGLLFYRSANGVWLTTRIEPRYITLVDG